jgi:hypothetical protein
MMMLVGTAGFRSGAIIRRMEDATRHDDNGFAEKLDPHQGDRVPERLSNQGAHSSVLLFDEQIDGVALDPTGTPFKVLDLPAVPASIVLCAGNEPAVVEVDDLEADGVEPIFATVASASGEQLVMLNATGDRTRVNGLPAPIIAPLSLGDQIRTDGGQLFHVSRKIQTNPAPPPSSLIGKRCEICLEAFAADTMVVVCPSCGAARHMEGEEVPVDERLECAALGGCPNCASEIPESGVLAFVPED